MSPLLLAIFIPAVPGLLIASWFMRNDLELCFFDRLCAGLVLGLGLASFLLFLNGVAGLAFSLPLVVGLLFIISVLFALLLRRTGAPVFSGGEGTILSRYRGALLLLAGIIAAYIALKFYFVLSESLIRPVFSWDTWFNWSAGAKFFYYEGGLALDPSNEHFFGTGYREFLGHPLNVPLLQVWCAMWLGEFHEVYVTVPSAVYFIVLVSLFYLALKKESGPLYGLIWAFMLAGSGLLTYHAIDAYADLPVATYFTGSFVFFHRYLRKRDLGMLVLAGLFLGMAAFTKNEGVIFFIAVGISLLLYLRSEGRGYRPFLYLVVPFAAIAAPWIIFKISYGIGFGHSGVGSGFEWFSDPKYAPGTERGVHFEIIGIALKEIFLTRVNFNLLFPFWIIVSLMGLKLIVKSEIRFLYSTVLLIIGAFFFIYLTLEATAVTQATGLHRNLMTYVPAIAYSGAVLLSRLLSKK